MPGLGPSSSGRTFQAGPRQLSVNQLDAACAILGVGDVSLATASVAQAVLSGIVGAGDVSLASPSVACAASSAIAGAGDISTATPSSAQAAVAALMGFSLVSATSVQSRPAVSAISGFGLVNVQMLGGISQPTPNGGDILYDDDSHADASLDAIAVSYSPEDLYQKSQANGWKATGGVLAAVEKWGGAVFGLLPRYWFHVSIQNGDGSDDVALGKTTTFKASRCEIVFDAGKTMKMSAVGIANRWTIMGLLQETPPGSPLGYDGIDATFGTTTTIDGNHQLYGSKLRTNATNSTINIRRTSTSAIGDAVSLTLETLGAGSSSNIAFGTSSIPTARAHHIYMNVLGAAGSGVNAFNVLDPDDIHFGGVSNTRINILAAYTLIRDGAVHGTPATADLRGSAGGDDLVDFTWSGAATQISAISGNHNDWRTWLPTVVDANGDPSAGELLELLDGSMTVVVSATSDSLGQITYTLPGITGIAIANAVLARHKPTASWVENGPFTVRRNGLTVNVFTWPRTSYVVAGTTYYQLLPVYETIGPAETLKAAFSAVPGGGPPPLNVQFTDLSTTRPGDSILSWSWEFGDGTTSAAQNPIHVYASEGLYAVKLTVTDSGGSESLTVIGAVFVQSTISPFQRQFVPDTPFVPRDIPSPAYVPRDEPVTAFVRTIPPDSTFAPCDDEPPPPDTRDFIIFEGIIMPIGDLPLPFRHRAPASTEFKHRTVPVVEYGTCGEATAAPGQEIIFGGVIIPVE